MGDASSRPGEQPPVALEKTVATLLNPARARLIALLDFRPGSGVAELSRWSGLGEGLVRRHLRVLLADGMVRAERSESRRGAAARFYVTTQWFGVSDEQDEALSEEMRRATSLACLRMIFEEVDHAASGGTLASRTDRVVTNSVGEVDERGWRELVAIHSGALRRIGEVLGQSRERLREDGAEPIAVVSGQILLERPGFD